MFVRQPTQTAVHPVKHLERWIRRIRRQWAKARACRQIVAAAHTVNLEALADCCSDLPRPDFIVVSNDSSAQGAAQCHNCLASVGQQLLPVQKTLLVAPRGVDAADGTHVECTAATGLLTSIKAAINALSANHVAMCDASATLCNDASLWMAVTIAEHPRFQALYADQLEIDSRGSTSLPPEPLQQPEFSWAYLLARNFIEPVVVYDRHLLEAAVDRLLARGQPTATAREALYAVALEALADCGQEDVAHVRHPLSSRAAPTAAEHFSANLPQIATAALAARNLTAQVTHNPSDPALHDLHFTRRRTPRVSIIIPTKNAAALVKTCVGSLRATAGYDNYDITVIDHDSDEPELRQFLAAESAAGGLRVMRYSGPFNYAAMNNAAVRQTTGELILLLNNDVDAFSEGWLDQLVATMELDDRCAAVGCLLFYPDGDIQHAGVISTARRLAFHAHFGLPHDALGYQGRVRSLQEYAAVTAALMLVRRSAFAAVGGFDEVFPNDYNDVDLCLRLRQAGHRILYTPHVRATHWESRTRRSWGTGKDVFVSRWGGYCARDPFYNPKLIPDGPQPDPLEAIWRERKTVALERIVNALGKSAVTNDVS